MFECLDKVVSHCKDVTKTGCFGGWSGKTPEVGAGACLPGAPARQRRPPWQQGAQQGCSRGAGMAHSAAALRFPLSRAPHRVRLPAAPPTPPPTPQCEAVLPTEEFEDGTKPPKKWNHYQLWWQTIMTKIAPELRGMGWGNLK